MGGFAALAAALLLTCASLFLTIGAYRKGVKESGDSANSLGKTCFYGSVLSILGASAYLLYLFLTNQFAYAYVWSYSSLDLPLFYKISAFWAGQEGSFLLWLLIHAICGVFLRRKERMGASAFGVYLFVQVLLLVMLFAKSPFMMMSQAQGDGAGLNPLLQDPWMALHPPIIFIGYALLSIPYSFAMGALLDGRAREWVERALPWTMAAWSFLGAGIFIGGYWAYKVLGWGGYWAWDPVENSSLVPWLLASVLAHLLLMARTANGALKPAYFAALFTFVSVLYGTFLTRSGVLGDFSVHSFSDGGIGIFLAAFVAVAGCGAFIALAVRWPELPDGVLYTAVKSRAFMLPAGMAVLVFMSLVVSLGMSMPLLSALAGKAQSVAPAFYHLTVLPLAIALLLLLNGSYLAGKKLKRTEIILISLCFVAGFYIAYAPLGTRAIDAVLVGASFSAALLSARRRWSAASTVAHCGLAILAAGIIFSSAGSRSAIAALPVMEVKTVLDHSITYQGVEIKEAERKKRYVFDSQGKRVESVTKLDRHGMDAAKAPGIDHRFWGDLYFAPSASAKKTMEHVLDRKKAVMGETLIFRFKELGEESIAEMKGKKVVKALVRVSDGERTEEAALTIVEGQDGFRAVPVQVLRNRYRLELTGVSDDGQKIRVRAADLVAEQNGEIQAEISWKPFIWMVWLGAGLIAAGCFAGACKRRAI